MVLSCFVHDTDMSLIRQLCN